MFTTQKRFGKQQTFFGNNSRHKETNKPPGNSSPGGIITF